MIDYPNDPGCRDDLDNSEVSAKEKLKEADIVGVVEEAIDSIQKSVLKNKYLKRGAITVVELIYILQTYKVITIIFGLLLLIILLYILFKRLWAE